MSKNKKKCGREATDWVTALLWQRARKETANRLCKHTEEGEQIGFFSQESKKAIKIYTLH